MIEAELKARVQDPGGVRALLLAAAGQPDMREALDELRALLLDLEISPDAPTTELYTDAVATARSGSQL